MGGGDVRTSRRQSAWRDRSQSASCWHDAAETKLVRASSSHGSWSCPTHSRPYSWGAPFEIRSLSSHRLIAMRHRSTVAKACDLIHRTMMREINSEWSSSQHAAKNNRKKLKTGRNFEY